MNRNGAQSARQADGFTLIELLIVIVILGILAAIVVFAVGGITDRGNSSACKTDRKYVETAEEAYYAKYSDYATVAELVTAKLLREQPATGNGYTITANETTGVVTASGSCT